MTVYPSDAAPSFFKTLLRSLSWIIPTLLWVPISAILLPLYLGGMVVWGRPPIVSSLSRIFKHCIATWTEGRPEDGVLLSNRVLIFLMLINILVKIPIGGVSWYLDEILFSGYHKMKIEKPLFLLTAARSGSTSLGNIIPKDSEHFIAPVLAEGLFPFIWLWRIVMFIAKIFGLKPKKLSAESEAGKRAEAGMFQTMTWVPYWHAYFFCNYLGAPFRSWSYINLPVDEGLLDNFIPFTDAVVKKVLYNRGEPNQRVFLKGHFIAQSWELEKRYPTAKFLTLVREPKERIRSMINFHMVLCCDGPGVAVYGLHPPSWASITDCDVEAEVRYLQEEMRFYDKSENKLVIPFKSYTSDLAGTLKRIYTFCDLPIADDNMVSNDTAAGHEKQKKVRQTYDPRLNRDLTSLGVDTHKLDEDTANYVEWMKQFED